MDVAVAVTVAVTVAVAERGASFHISRTLKAASIRGGSVNVNVNDLLTTKLNSQPPAGRLKEQICAYGIMLAPMLYQC